MSRFGFSGALLATVLVTACELETVSVPATTPSVVVHAVLNPSASSQIVFLERTLTGSQRVPDPQFDPNDPILSAGGIPISDALVEISDSTGAAVAGVEEVKFLPKGQGHGVYQVPITGGLLRLGERYKLHIHTAEGEDVTAFTRIPAPEVTSTGGLTSTVNRDHDTVNVSWSRADRTRAYAMRVESPFGPFFLFTDSLHVRLAGDLRNLFAGQLQRVLIPGFHQDIIVAAVDSNFFDYYRTNNDPFTGSGIISRINGGIGLFGSLVTLTNGTMTVIADQTEPIEGRFRATTVVDSAVPASSFNLYVESPAVRADAPAALSGRYNTPAPFVRADGLIGTLKGNEVTIAFLSGQLASDTVDVFEGTLQGGTITGHYRRLRPTTTFIYSR